MGGRKPFENPSHVMRDRWVQQMKKPYPECMPMLIKLMVTPKCSSGQVDRVWGRMKRAKETYKYIFCTEEKWHETQGAQ